MFLKHRFRWFILAIGLFCFTSIASNAVVFNMAVVCMASDSNTTILETFPSLDYTQYEITQTNWALGLGTAIATIPFSEVYSRYGAKFPFFGACIVSALSTALLPFGAEKHFAWLLVLRVLQGIAFAADFASVGLLCSKWSTLKQTGLFISLITIYAPLSVGFTNVLSGIVCDTTYGWPLVYHLHAVVGIVAALLWLVFYEDSPSVSRRVSPKELKRIQKGRADTELEFGEPAPYMLLLKDPIIWSIWFSGAMEVFSTNFLAIYAPLYIRYALGYTVEFTGYYSGISRAMQIPTRLVVGFFGHSVSCLSEKHRIIMYNTIALIGGGISMFLIPLSSYTTPFVAIIFISLVNLTTGVCSCGYWQAAILYSRQHSHFVMAVILFFKCVNLFLGPLLMALFVPEMDHKGQWGGIFIGIGVLMIIAGLVFVKYSESKPAKYLENTEKVTVEFPEDDPTVTSEHLKVLRSPRWNTAFYIMAFKEARGCLSKFPKVIMTTFWNHRFRFFILIIGIICFTSLASNAMVFSMVVVCMASDANTTNLLAFPPVDYDQFDITKTNWALALGTALATIPFSEVYSRFGAKYPFFAACVLSAISTALLPFGAEAGFEFLLILRLLQGIAFAADFASVGLVCSKWSTLKQSGLFISLVTCYAPLSVGFTNVLSGVVCDSKYGWPMVYHLHAIVGIIAALFWLIYYEDTPAKSIRVSPQELQKIQKGRADKELSYNETTPYTKLLSDPIIWSIWCNGSIEVFATNFLSVYAALYIRYALGYSVELTGYYSGISKSMQMPTRILVGLFGHKIGFLSEKHRVILFNSIALIGGGISMFMIPISAYSSAFMAIIFISLVNLCTGVASCGFYHAAILYSRQHCHFVMAVVLFSQCVNLFVGPLLTAVFVPEMEDKGQWAGIFIETGILMVVCGVAFLKYSDTQPPEYLTDFKNITVEVPEDAEISGVQLDEMDKKSNKMNVAQT